MDFAMTRIYPNGVIQDSNGSEGIESAENPAVDHWSDQRNSIPFRIKQTEHITKKHVFENQGIQNPFHSLLQKESLLETWRIEIAIWVEVKVLIPRYRRTMWMASRTKASRSWNMMAENSRDCPRQRLSRKGVSFGIPQNWCWINSMSTQNLPVIKYDFDGLKTCGIRSQLG